MKKTNRFVKDMTEGVPYQLLLKFTIPLLFGNIFQQLYNYADSYIVSRYVGSNALGATGSTGSLVFFFFSLIAGLSTGIGIIVSQYFGIGNEKKVKDSIGTGFSVILVCSFVMASIGFFAARPLLTLLKLDKVLMTDAVNYLRILAIGMLWVGIYNGVSNVLRALGDSKTPLIFLIVSSLLNVGLDLLFVVVFKWGVIGAGVATVMAQFVSAISCIIYAYRSNTYFRLTSENLSPDTALIGKICRLGIPVALQNSMIAFSLVILQAIVNSYGPVFTTAFTVVGRIEQLIQQPFMSLGAALATYTGQNIGAGKIKRVKRGFKSATIISTIFALFIIAIFWGYTKPIVSTLARKEDVMIYAMDGLRITCLFYPFLGLIYTTRNVLNGAGDAMFSLFTGIVECIGRVVFAYPLTLIPFMGKYGVFYATGLTWFLNGGFSFIRYKLGKWKTINVVENIVE